MDFLKKLIIFSLPLTLTGCYEEFDPHIDTKPVLCLNSLITAGSPISVDVSRTWVFTDEDDREERLVKDAVVDIYVDGHLVDAGYIPKEGDRIRIHASSPAYGDAEAEVTVPIATRISKSDYSTDLTHQWMNYTEGWGLNANISFNIRMSLKLEDSPQTYGYYRLAYDTYEPEGNYGIPSKSRLSSGHFEALDPVFYEQADPFDEALNNGGYRTFFSDRLLGHEVPTLTFGFSPCFFNLTGWDGNPDDLECGWEITLYSISESYYKWLVYVDQSDGIVFGDFGDLGMADPIWGYSNVSTGAGVVAAQSSATATIDLRPFLEKIFTRK